MPLGLAVFVLGLAVSGTILFGLFLFYAHAFADEVAHEGQQLPPRVASIVKALDQEAESPGPGPPKS
jgi:hypothetical protein